MIKYALVGAALGAMVAWGTPEAPNFNGCEVVRSYEDNSHLIDCSMGEEEPDFNPDFWEQLDIIREQEGAEYA